MNNESSNVSSSGIGFFGLLQIAFIVLKVTNLINWSWWMVFIPTFISVGIILIGLIVIVIACVIENWSE